MSCVAGNPSFRLLDAYVGWDAAYSTNLVGVDAPAGVCLAPVHSDAVDLNQVVPYLPPARLARGCAACEWYLITPFPPESRLLHRDACHRNWELVWKSPCTPAPFKDAVAVATWRRFIAVSDRGANQVLVWGQSGGRLVAEISVEQPGPLAFTPRGELLLTSPTSVQVARYGLDGALRGFLAATLPGLPSRIAVDRKNGVWVLVEREDSWTLWCATDGANQFQSASVDALRQAFRPSGLLTASDAGFCFDEDTGAMEVTTCYSWYGRPVKHGTVIPPKPPQRYQRGQLLTLALDSGIPRCKWHRVRLDADVPAGTTLTVAVASAEDAAERHGDLVRDPEWKDFPTGQPHHADWTSAPAGSVDFLIDQPPGRYLFFRMRMTGDGTATPIVRRVRIDFPRLTSLDHLPAVYRENPRAEDFTARFLSLFDASIADMDRVIERYPALLDPSGVPEQLLPWLGGFFDIGFDSSWDADKRRTILRYAPQLYRLRGTLTGLRLAICLVFGVQPAIEELSSTGMWGALGNREKLQALRCEKSTPPPSVRRNARLRATRLFGKSRARFHLGRSPIGGAPLRSYGNPDQDPFAAGAYQFRVLVPPLADRSKAERDRLTNLIDAQKPAHTVAAVRVGGTGFLLGQWSAVGVDTAFIPLAAPILGKNGNVRLNRMSILWNGPAGPAGGPAVGQNFIVGMQPIAG
jgi:phage tail-like protein